MALRNLWRQMNNRRSLSGRSKGRRARETTFRPALETLEDRVTPSTVMGDYVSLDNGILTICGTSGNDQVDVSKAAQQVKVEARLADGAITIEEFFSSSEVNRIVIQVYEGDDQVDLGKRILTHALIDAGAGNDQVQTGKGDSIIDGGAGNDKIQTGSGNDVLVGGAGDDDLSGGSGFNMMIGGLGSDSLFSDGTDILIGGSTSGTIVNVLVAHAVWIGTSGDETAVGGLLTVLDDGAVDEVLSADANDLDLGG